MSTLALPVFKRLNEAQILAVLRGASPLHQPDREAYYAVVAELLAAEAVIGDGVVYRCVREAQQQFEHLEPAAGSPGARYHRPHLEPLEQETPQSAGGRAGFPVGRTW